MIYLWYKDRPIEDQEEAKRLLATVVCEGSPLSNMNDFRFPDHIPTFGEKAKSRRSIRSGQDLWQYNKDKTVRIWNGWMGDIEILSSHNDGGHWNPVVPSWSGRQFRIQFTKEDGKRSSCGLFDWVARQFGLLTDPQTQTAVPKDGDVTNIRINNIEVVNA